MMYEFIPRPHYLEVLREFRDKPFVKVITGMRRCGKSTLMVGTDELRTRDNKLSDDEIKALLAKVDDG